MVYTNYHMGSNIAQRSRNQVPSIGRTSVSACLYDVNRGRLTYLSGFQGVFKYL